MAATRSSSRRPGTRFGAGLTYTPVWAKGLSASVDYFQLNHSNQISVASPDDVLFECAEHGSSPAKRSPAFRTAGSRSWRLPTDNFGESEVRAFDFAINWSAMTRIGEVNSRLLATYLDRWDKQPFPGGEVHSYAGNFDARRPAALARVGAPRLALRAVDGQLRGRIYRQLLGTVVTGRRSASNSIPSTAASIRSCITTSKRDSNSTQASRCERRSPMSPMKTRPTSTSRPAIRMWLPTGCWAAATFWSCVTRSSSPRWKND